MSRQRTFFTNLGLLAVAGLCLLPLTARAEVFNTGRILKPGAFSIAGEFQRSFNPSGTSANLGLGLGLASQLDLGLQVRFPLEGSPSSLYYGADLEFSVLVEGRSSPALSLSLGGHALGGRYAADATLMASKVLAAHFEPYVAVDADVGIHEELGTQVRAVLGVCLPIAAHFEILVEGGLGLTASTRDYMSGGFNLYF